MTGIIRNLTTPATLTLSCALPDHNRLIELCVIMVTKEVHCFVNYMKEVKNLKEPNHLPTTTKTSRQPTKKTHQQHRKPQIANEVIVTVVVVTVMVVMRLAFTVLGSKRTCCRATQTQPLIICFCTC